jgi:CheY-like chemotaxis protein/nitrogen-specific signal transduction histidine kinase
MVIYIGYAQGTQIFHRETIVTLIWGAVNFAALFSIFIFGRKFQNLKNLWIFEFMYLLTLSSTNLVVAYVSPIISSFCKVWSFSYGANFLILMYMLNIFTVQLGTRYLYLLINLGAVIYQNYYYNAVRFPLSYLLDTILLWAFMYVQEKTSRNAFYIKYTEIKNGQTLKSILNEIPENIMILDKTFKEKYVNKVDLADGSLHLDSLESLKQVSDLNLRISSNHQSSLNPAVTALSLITENSVEISCLNADSQPYGEGFTSKTSLYDLVTNLGHKDALCHYLTELKKKDTKHSLIFDCKYQKADGIAEKKSLEIKTCIANFYQEECLVLIFRDTTQRDIIASLQDNSQYKDKLMASVSHELRTPLNGNINFINAALHEDTLPTSIKDNYLLPALRAGTLLQHMINDIIDYSLILKNEMKLQPKSASLKETMSECLQLVETQAKVRGINLKLEYDDSIPSEFSTDHARLHQLVLNLLNNALKFTMHGSITLRVIKAQENAQVLVIDTGNGISEENQRQLQELFNQKGFQTHNQLSRHGAGLGLQISSVFAVLLGSPSVGSGLKLDSILGTGSTFSFMVSDHHSSNRLLSSLNDQFFLHTEEDAQEEYEEFLARKMPSYPELFASKINYLNKELELTGREMLNLKTDCSHIEDSPDVLEKGKECKCPRALVVDDDAFNVLSFEKLLQVLGVTAEHAYNGQIAVDMVLAREKKPCGKRCHQYKMIFMDCCMPIMDGIEATKEIRSNLSLKTRKELNIVGCTAFTSEQKVKECQESGMNEVISKPMSRNKIKEVMQKYNL